MDRRSMIRAGGLLLAGGVLSLAGQRLLPDPAAADWRRRSPDQTEGPFYPLQKPVDRDADLVRIDGMDSTAAGETMLLLGQVRQTGGALLDGARVEIWQCDAGGRYIHPGDRGGQARDPGFQGFGQTITGPDGTFRFRTIRPVPYPGRTPHIHVKVFPPAGPVLTTQLYLHNHPLNRADDIFLSLSPAGRRQLSLTPVPATIGETRTLVAVTTLIVQA